MTRKELHRIKAEALLKGYKWKQGYCCFQEDGISRYDLIEIGHNTGIYGWNWTLYLHTETKTYYLSCYRNT